MPPRNKKHAKAASGAQKGTVTHVRGPERCSLVQDDDPATAKGGSNNDVVSLLLLCIFKLSDPRESHGRATRDDRGGLTVAVLLQNLILIKYFSVHACLPDLEVFMISENYRRSEW